MYANGQGIEVYIALSKLFSRDQHGTWYIYNFSFFVWSEQQECEWMITNQPDIGEIHSQVNFNFAS